MALSTAARATVRSLIGTAHLPTPSAEPFDALTFTAETIRRRVEVERTYRAAFRQSWMALDPVAADPTALADARKRVEVQNAKLDALAMLAVELSDSIRDRELRVKFHRLCGL